MDKATNGEGTTVLMQHEGNLGYGITDVDTGMTLGELLEAVQDAVDEWGEEARVVTYQTNNHYGANYGSVKPWAVFRSVEGDGEDEG